MLRKLSEFPLVAYLSLVGLVESFKKDERGLSGVVVAVLLILVAVLAIILLWNQLSTWLTELWTRITGSASNIN